MALQTSGQMKMTNIATEFGDTAPHEMEEFVRGGGLVPDAAANANIPTTTSNMKFSGFYGAVNVIAVTATNSVNVSLATAFGASWTQNVPKEYIIPSGVTIGASSASSAALTVEGTLVGSLTIKNSGSIHGAGGASGSAGVGGNGGDAISVGAICTIINESTGQLYGGGGGGGLGGTGGQGSFSSVQQLGASPLTERLASRCDLNCSKFYGAGAYCCGVCFDADDNDFECNMCCRVVTTITNGGAGGAGGVGQGYNQSATAGAAGSAGGTNAGAGGTGGTGGSFGATGATGATGANGNYSAGLVGSSGGAGGRYIVGISNVTLTNNGSVAGGTA
jgi:hypothetical protein